MDDGPPPPEEDFSGIPLEDRLAHKNWKARVHGYEQLMKNFAATGSESDPAFKPYLNNPDLLKKMATDTNVVAQEKGVEVVLTLVKFAGENAASTRETVMPAVVEKCFGSTRAGTKQKAWALAVEYVEVENTGEGVVRDIIVGLSAKQPKAVAASVAALKEIIKSFGTKVVPPGPILKVLPKIFAHTDKTVRAEGTLLAQSLNAWLGPALQPALADLKPVQVKELNDSFEALNKEGKGAGSGKQERFTKIQAREAEASQMNGDVPVADEEPEEIDPRTFAEEVDVVPKIPADFYTNISSSKWKERKEALDAVLDIVKPAVRIADSDGLGDLVKALAGRMPDANVMCVMVAANIIGLLARGLGDGFGKHRSTVVPPMLERFKERKQNVVDAIGEGLDGVFLTTTLPDITEEILNALKSKNPQVKEATLKFFNRCLSTTKIPPAKADIKPIAELLVSLLSDSSEPVRNSAQESLGTLMKIIGERPMNPFLEAVESLKRDKIKEAFEKATVKCKAGGGPPPKPAAPAVPSAAKRAPHKPLADIQLDDDTPAKPLAKPPARLLAKKPPPPSIEEIPVDDDEPPKPVRKPPARLLAKKVPTGDAESSGPSSASPSRPPPVVKKAPPPAAVKVVTGGSKPAHGAPPPSDSFKYKFNPEDAEALAADLIPAQIATDLADSAWKTRLAALDEAFPQWLDGVIDSAECEVLFRFLGKKPGWNEKNFQVSAKVFGIFNTLAERSPTFGKSCVALATPHLTEKLGDLKLKKPAGDTLITFAEKTSLSFVLGLAYEPIIKQKSPKMLADSVAWVNIVLTDFGITGLALRPLVEFLKSALKNSNAAVRTSATTTLVTLRLFAGSGIKDFLEDLNPQLLTTIQSEFDKVDDKPPPVPTRVSADVAAAPAVSGGKGKGSSSADPLDDLFPRVDLEKIVSATSIIADAKSDAWKVRKEALESLQAILDVGTNKRVKPNLGEIPAMLKPRIGDTNKVVQGLALGIVARIATAMNKPFEKYARIVVLPVAQVMADQKNHIRAAAATTMTAIATACEGIEPMAHFIGTALEATNPLLRASLLGWLADWLKEHEIGTNADLSNWAAPLVSCLEDRNGDVRKGAQAVLPSLIARIGYDLVMDKVNALKPASRSTVTPFIQAAAKAAGDLKGSSTPSVSSSAPVSASSKSVTASSSTKSLSTSSSNASSIANPTSPAPPAAKRQGLLSRRLGQPPSRPPSRAEEPEERPPSSAGLRAPVKSKLFGLKRPVSTIFAKHPPASSPVASSAPFSGSSPDPKRARLAKDAGRWIIESGPTRKDLADILQHQMDPYASRDLIGLLFSHDHNAGNDHVAGLGIICDAYNAALEKEEAYGLSAEELSAVLVANADLPLKYVSLRIHEPQPNLINKCLDVVDIVVNFLGKASHVMPDAEAICFIPTIIHKLGDAREVVRNRVQTIIQTLPTVVSFARLFSFLQEHGLRSKVAKTRQGALDEMANLIRKKGMTTCDPLRAFPVIGTMVNDKDAQVRKSALSVIGECYMLEGDRVWEYLGRLDAKSHTQVEEKLKRLPSPSKGATTSKLPGSVTPLRNGTTIPRPASPATGPGPRKSLGARPGSPAGVSRLARPMSPPSSPLARSSSPIPQSATSINPSSPSRPKTLPSSRLAAPRSRPLVANLNSTSPLRTNSNAARRTPSPDYPMTRDGSQTPSRATLLDPMEDRFDDDDDATVTPDSVTITISSILSGDPSRSVDALKKIQKVLEPGSEQSLDYQHLSAHTDGLVETITLQMQHVFDRPDGVTDPNNYRLAKHLIQTLNAFCDHTVLTETLPVDILTSLLEELTSRLLQTDESGDGKVKDLSRFINMIILRLFATGRRINIFRALFNLLLQITRPFTAKGTDPRSREARLAELVLKCMWKLARGIPQDLEKRVLDPIEVFPALEAFLQAIPPNEWRARAASKVPCGDMPLRTIKVIIQHVVGAFGEEVYDMLSASFDDPSATIVYPYVYRILNSTNSASGEKVRPSSSSSMAPSMASSMVGSIVGHSSNEPPVLPTPLVPDVPPPYTASVSSSIRPRSDSTHSRNGRIFSSGDSTPSTPNSAEVDLDVRLTEIIGHISSETTGAMHKEGITELHYFLKQHPHKKPKVDKMLDATGPQFRKYLARALASRAAEDEDRRGVEVAATLSRLESGSAPIRSQPTSPTSVSSRRSPPTVVTSSRRVSAAIDSNEDPALSRLHELFQYRRTSISSVAERRDSRASVNSSSVFNTSPPVNEEYVPSDADQSMRPL